MKKKLVLYTLFLSISFFLSLAIQAQEQKKPSERSFAAEINKIKQIQAARNTTIRQIQQPTENTLVSNTDNRITNEPGSIQSSNTNSNTSKENAQQAVTTKPSSGVMRQPRKPAVSKE